MGPVAAVKTVFRKTFNWRGRAPMSEFWWFALFAAICYILSIVVTIVTEGHVPLIALAVVGLLVPHIGVMIRRLHDSGRSGGWWFIGLVPFGSIVLLVFMLHSGDRIDNRYGPPYRA